VQKKKLIGVILLGVFGPFFLVLARFDLSKLDDREEAEYRKYCETINNQLEPWDRVLSTRPGSIERGVALLEAAQAAYRQRAWLSEMELDFGGDVVLGPSLEWGYLADAALEAHKDWLTGGPGEADTLGWEWWLDRMRKYLPYSCKNVLSHYVSILS